MKIKKRSKAPLHPAQHSFREGWMRENYNHVSDLKRKVNPFLIQLTLANARRFYLPVENLIKQKWLSSPPTETKVQIIVSWAGCK